jgi:hypothetical protein
MRTIILAVAVAVFGVGGAAAQTQPERQVNPSTHNTTGRDSTFGMNNGGDQKSREGLHGGPTDDTYRWLKDKERTNNESMKAGSHNNSK